MVGYNDLKQEMCFHCKYGFFVSQSISVLLLTFLMLESLPWRSFLVAFLLFCIVIGVRTIELDERKKQMAKKQRLKEKRAKEKKEELEMGDIQNKDE